MKLLEALEILKKEQPEKSAPFRAFLVCGFTPLHLQTFLDAHLRLALPGRRTEILSGLYGDFWGNLDRVAPAGADAAIVVLEWSDLDPRLGLRSLGSWEPATLPEILNGLRVKTIRFLETAAKASQQTVLIISLPTLPLPPVSYSPGWQAGNFELDGRALLSSMAAELGRMNNVKVVSSTRLDTLSAPANRLDAKSEIASGFPYKLAHASVMAELMSLLVLPASPKKGLITDLDDTLWNGILGEVGAEGIYWDLEHNSQVHGLYQRLLRSLSESGTLIAAASKNDPRVVDEAFARKDLILPRNSIFPLEAHWGPKSESVSRILKAWNFGADAVVFVDDSPMELAEVQAAHPDIECILFPGDNPQAAVDLLYQLRDRFGKSALSEEDAIRRESLRRNRENAAEFSSHNGNLSDFLSHAEAELTINFAKEPLDPRALELMNKTNQFNLNGKRFTQTEWQAYMKRPDTFLLTASYRDKYGPLGKIAVLAGQRREGKILLDVWVMSCRAFSRQVEHRCIEEIFGRFGAGEIEFDFQATSKNGPLQEFLGKILGAAPSPHSKLSRENFEATRQETFHRVLEATNG